MPLSASVEKGPYSAKRLNPLPSPSREPGYEATKRQAAAATIFQEPGPTEVGGAQNSL